MTRAAIQLHTLRALDEPLPEAISRAATVGFEGVEFSPRVHEAEPNDVRTALEEHDVEPVGVHVGLDDLRQNLDSHLDRYEAIGCRRVVIPHLHESHFRVERRVRALADVLNEIGASLAARGFELVYHNTHHDFLPLIDDSPGSRLLSRLHPRPLEPGDSPSNQVLALGAAATDVLFERLYQRRAQLPQFEETAFYRLCELTDPEAIAFEVDIGCVAAAGYAPTEVIDHLGSRVPLVHMADVTADRRAPWIDPSPVDPGEGIVDFKAATAAARRAGTEWLIFEHDNPDDPEATLRLGATALHVTPPAR